MAATTNSNHRRIMIITSDEKIIQQIQTNNSPSSYQTIFLDDEDNDNELSEPSSLDDKHRTHQKKTRRNNSLICVICGSSALGRNFGVITCESCKLFFRRNALKNPATLVCHHNNKCEIKYETRRRCSACRLNKCLNSGMRRDRLLKAEEKATKPHQIKTNHMEINNQGSDSLLYLDHLFTSRHTNFTQYLSQPVMLTSEDFERIEAVRIAFEKRIELATRDGLPWDPSVFATNFLEHLNARSVGAMRLLAFFKQIPEFDQLNVDDKMVLIKYNLMPLMIFNCTLSYNINTQQFIEADNDMPWSPFILQTVHGEETFSELTKIFITCFRIAQYDPKIIHLAMIVFLLSKSLSTGDGTPEPILKDNMAVYRAQNSYTELLWKYLELFYGFEQAFHITVNLVTRFLTWQIVEKKIRSNVARNVSATATVENDLLPLMKSLFHI